MENEFDIICFKSMLGGIVRNNDLIIAKKIIAKVHKALRPRGVLLFAENMAATPLHSYMKNIYGAKKNNWKYFTVNELVELFDIFDHYDYKTRVLLGCFSPNEKSRSILGHVDNIFDFFPNNWKYIFFGAGRKKPIA